MDYELAKEMWDMPLNSNLEPKACDWIITRVPGGWIYRHKAGEFAAFVPLDNEFTRTAGA